MRWLEVRQKDVVARDCQLVQFRHLLAERHIIEAP
jgi:hypothetical protein